MLHLVHLSLYIFFVGVHKRKSSFLGLQKSVAPLLLPSPLGVFPLWFLFIVCCCCLRGCCCLIRALDVPITLHGFLQKCKLGLS